MLSMRPPTYSRTFLLSPHAPNSSSTRSFEVLMPAHVLHHTILLTSKSQMSTERWTQNPCFRIRIFSFSQHCKYLHMLGILSPAPLLTTNASAPHPDTLLNTLLRCFRSLELELYLSVIWRLEEMWSQDSSRRTLCLIQVCSQHRCHVCFCVPFRQEPVSLSSFPS